MNIGVQTDHDAFGQRNRKIWILFFALAILLHLLLFTVRFDWDAAPPPSRMEVQEIDPQKLDSIRRQWDKKQKSLLLRPNTPKTDDKASPDARYFSDRNTRVEKEQKARNSNVLPKPGRQNGSDTIQEKKRARQHSRENKSKIPDLKSLAVPFHLDGKARPEKPTLARKNETEQTPSDQRGADQAIDDPNLPVGGENLLNTQESIYYSFYARIYEAIAPLWQSRTNTAIYHQPLQPGDYITRVELILDQEGILQEIRLLQSSGVPAFDDAVVDSWNKVHHFPNPPRGLLDREKLVHTKWSFKVSIGQGLNFDYLPPQRSDFP